MALRFIRSCSAPLDQELAIATSATFRAPVISAYGMTETSHQVSSNPLPVHGSNKTSSVGQPTGVEIRIVAEDGKDAALTASATSRFVAQRLLVDISTILSQTPRVLSMDGSAVAISAAETRPATSL